uniref:S1C family serine protease n=1 Tax=[Lactobacillus] rogosae TaxID=706562 RepID=UPI00402AF149
MYNNEDNDYMNNNSDNNSRNYENVEPDNNQSTGTTGYTTYSHNTGYNQNSAGGAGMNNGQNQYSNGSNNYGYNGYGYNQGGMNNSQYGANTSYNSTGTNAGYNNTAYNNGANTGFHNASDNSNSTYRYSYVNNNIGSDQNNSYRNAQRAAKQAKKEARKKSFNNWFSKNSTAKKYISGVLAAVVFGVVAGSAMYGTYHIEKKYLGGNDTKNYTISTVTSNIDKVTSDDINANGDTNLSQYSSMNVESVAQAALPAMVALNGTTTVSSSSSMYGWGQQQYEASTSGTGIIVGKNDTELLIVTNAHVVDNVSNLKCVFVDDQSVSATVKGSKSDQDIAVVAVSLSDIPSDTISKIAIAELADSDTIAVGQQVVAIGNALGEGQSVTNGIISALDRSITVNNVTFSGLIMTNAAINSGNSGGALLNASGKVIAINFAKTSSDGVEGMAYSIPVSNVKELISSLMSKQTRQKVDSDNAGYLGIVAIDITSTYASMYGYPQGIMVRTVASGSAAEKAGLSAYDIIVGFDDQSISTMSGLQSLLQYYSVGETVKVDYYHLEGSEYVLKSVEVTLGKKN